MKVAFIHNEKKIGTGAHYINDLMASKLKESGVEIKNFYPRTSLADTPLHLRGLKNILFFYSLLEKRKEILKFNIIQGTTYTPLPFLAFPVPVVSHFGSTTRGFLEKTPMARNIEASTRKQWYKLRKEGVISELNSKTRRPLKDIAEIEEYVASRATAVIATSNIVKQELLAAGVNEKNIYLIHNAIEDYWFEGERGVLAEDTGIVFLGRLGSDAFTLKLKGFDRLVHLYERFPYVRKTTLCMTKNTGLTSWMRSKFSNHTFHANVQKDKLPAFFKSLRGHILFISSRYEGFSLSLVEGMSQGLIPVTYAVGVAPEIIRNGENGFVVSSQEEAIEKMKLIMNDQALRARLSEEAIKTSHQFTGTVIARKLLWLYESVIPPKIFGPKRERRNTSVVHI